MHTDTHLLSELRSTGMVGRPDLTQCGRPVGRPAQVKNWNLNRFLKGYWFLTK